MAVSRFRATEHLVGNDGKALGEASELKSLRPPPREDYITRVSVPCVLKKETPALEGHIRSYVLCFYDVRKHTCVDYGVLRTVVGGLPVRGSGRTAVPANPPVEFHLDY